jgi:hypothetical protein
VLAALNDPDRTLIGDPRERVYKVAFQFGTVKEALELARQLAMIGIVPRTMIDHDEFGLPLLAQVTIWAKDDQRRLLEGAPETLDESQHQKLEDLVSARGPIPEDILERMVQARERGWSSARTASKMNEQGIIAGMGGVRWTARKVKAALVDYDERHAEHREAA